MGERDNPGAWWRAVETIVDLVDVAPSLDLRREPPVDWTFEREWRVPGELRLPDGGAVALVEGWRDVDEIYDRFDGAPPCAGVIPLAHLFGSAR